MDCLDGARVASDPATTTAEPINGYWRAGHDVQGGWPNASASTFWRGSLDNIAVCPTALTPAQVASHYNNR